MNIITRSIPAGSSYPGLIAHKTGPTTEIVVMGWGPEAERALEEAVIRRRPEVETE
jgi:hypothetical protein